MKISHLKELIQLVETSEIDELEISRWGRRVRISRTRRNHQAAPRDAMTVVELPPAAPPAPAPGKPEALSEAIDHLVPVKAPMVGTFYRAPAPDARPFVEVGERVEVGQVLCIIEAMKLMNEIQSDVAGRVESIRAENAQPVEFGQVLFVVSTA